MIKLIAVVDEKFGISKCGDIPWSFREDLKFFKIHTENCVVVMGRKTFFTMQSIPLKNRINCVVSKTLKTIGNSAELFSSLEAVIEKYKNIHDIWIIGGAELYNYSLNKKIIEYALLTQVQKDFEADNFLDASLLSDFRKKTLFDSKNYSIYEYLLVFFRNEYF